MTGRTRNLIIFLVLVTIIIVGGSYIALHSFSGYSSELTQVSGSQIVNDNSLNIIVGTNVDAELVEQAKTAVREYCVDKGLQGNILIESAKVNKKNVLICKIRSDTKKMTVKTKL
jgi:hypothetical protein